MPSVNSASPPRLEPGCADARTDGKPADLSRVPDEELAAAGPAIILDLACGAGEKEISKSDLAAMTLQRDWVYGSSSPKAFAACATR